MTSESTSAGSESRDPLIDTTVAGRYKLIGVLGRGGMGKVYLGEHIAIRKRVAIKILHQAYCERPALVKRFLIEARAATSIAHENVIEITDFGETDTGAAFFVMELLEGEELGVMLRRERVLPWSRVSRILYQICRALEAAHDKGIVHRDMKPANCFLIQRSGIDDFVKLLDFGIAKVVQSEDPDSIGGLTEAGAVIGTPEFMAPEQIQGAPVDKRMDIYAVGCIAYRMLTGHLPFRDNTSYGTMTLQVHADPVPPRDRNPEANIPEPVEALVLRALEKNPDDRFQSMGDMIAAIEQICSVEASLNAEASQMLRVTTSASMPAVDLGRTEPQEDSSASTSAPPTPVPGGHVYDPLEDAMTSQLDAMPKDAEPIVVPGTMNKKQRLIITALVGLVSILLLLVIFSGDDEPEPEPKPPPKVVVIGGSTTDETTGTDTETDTDSETETESESESESDTGETELIDDSEPTKKKKKRVGKRKTPSSSSDQDTSKIVLNSLDFMERSRGVRSVKKRTDACASNGSGTVKVEIVVVGKTGRVSQATPSPANALGRCLARSVKRAKFSRFRKSSQTFTHTFNF